MLWLCWLACAPQLEETAAPVSGPELHVDRAVVDFGDVAVNQAGPAYQALQITNTGTEDLHIAGFDLESGAPFGGNDSPFRVGTVTSVLIPPGGAVELELEFLPETLGEFSDTLQITSNARESSVFVDVVGTGTGAVLHSSHDHVDFGEVPIGCEQAQDVILSNLGTLDLTINGIELGTSSTALGLDQWGGQDPDTNPLPWSLAPGETASVSLTYFPLQARQDSAYLLVDSDAAAPLDPVPRIEGTGQSNGQVVDVFELALSSRVDVLFSLDRSTSMEAGWDTVDTAIQTFLDAADRTDADFHIAAVVADDGCVLGDHAFLDSALTSTERSDAFDAMACLDATTPCPSAGHNTERAFMLLEAALSSSNLSTGGCNEGLLRDSATLHLVAISDEPEQSVNSYSYYVSLFQSMKSNPDDVVFHAVGGDYPTGCSLDDQSAVAFTGAYEATVATGGLFLSICSADIGDHLSTLLGPTDRDRRSVELSETPVAQTLRVTVDGVPVTSGWTWDAVTNTVDFDEGAEPAGGATVEVTYERLTDCG